MRVFKTMTTTEKRKSRASRGFTLAEMLVVIAIIAILVGIVAIAASDLLASMQQNKLDTIAQDIYVTAQERLTEMYTDNRADEVRYEELAATSTVGLAKLSGAPADWDGGIEFPASGLDAMYNQQAPAAAAVLMPAGALSSEVEARHWIIEYNPEYGYIYGVFYSEKGFNPADIESWYSSGTADKYRTYADRKGSGVGYYGGTGVLGGKVEMTNTSLNISVDILNAEELKAELTVRIPAQYKDRVVRLKVNLTGETSGTSVDRTVLMDSTQGFFNRTYTMTMDKLIDGQQFKDLFAGMTPGENVLMTVEAELGSVGSGGFAADATLDTAKTTALFNSLFQSVDGTTAYVSAGRHLQNLNNVAVTISSVVQTANIDFANETPDVADDAIYWWKETYGNKKFVPINNSAIRSFLGSAKDNENNTVYYIIYGMQVDGTMVDGTPVAYSGPAGMFGTLGRTGADTYITDVSLVGSRITGTNSVGALAGASAGNVILKNTGAYLLHEDYNDREFRDEEVPALTGVTVGGLIGTVSGNVYASESYAAEVLRGSYQIGGLFGNVMGTMELNRSYTDCYMDATEYNCSVGGLAAGCGPDSTINLCYAAGFTYGTPRHSAGFVPSAVASMKNSYSVLNIGPEDAKAVDANPDNYAFYATAADCANVNNVYYALPDGANYANLHPINGVVEKSMFAMRSSKAAQYLPGDGAFRFSYVSGDTTAYNLREDLGLSNYPYPFLYREDGTTIMHHYGDWDGLLFDPGTLVYFEEYSDGFRGYYGANSNNLSTNKQVVRDGYALLYTEDFVEKDGFGKTEATITYMDQTVNLPAITGTNGEYSVMRKTLGGSVEAKFYFRDLPGSIINSSYAASADFYTFIKVYAPESDPEYNDFSYYYFNPHFAATVEQVEREGSEKPTLENVGDNTVRIRTPRHLNLLSKYFSGHCGAMTGEVTLRQELELDYTKYHWTDAGYTAAVTSQKPIGNNKYAFNAIYNGRSNPITGVQIVSEDMYTGLFGYVGGYGRLTNIILGAQKADDRYVDYKKDPSVANDYAYAGTLAGYNSGVISNCAAAGYFMKLDTYYTTLYAGGLVGYNNGTISNCSIENPLISVNTNSANAFVGSFAGLNSGSGVITSCCSMSSLDVSRFTSGTVRVGGFAGGNAGTIKYSYTAAAVVASNISEKDVEGFTHTGGNVQSCYFLTGGTYKFAGAVNAYGQESQTANASVGAQNLPGYGAISLNGFGKVSSSTNCYFNNEVKASSSPLAGKYPFGSPVYLYSTSSAEEKTYIFCGDWITDDIFGNTGMLYWEHEVGGANEGYHFYLVDNTGKSFTTLCTAHDDDGVISEYGYGYYQLKNLDVADPTFSNMNGRTVAQLEPYRNLNAETNLSGQFADSYTFVLYNTSGAFQDIPNGVYVTGNNAYAKAVYDGQTYSFSPFFGATLAREDSTPTEMEVRSIDQLQFLNWNYTLSQEIDHYEFEEEKEDTSKWTYKEMWDEVRSGDSPRKTAYYFESDGKYYPISVTRTKINDERRYTLQIEKDGKSEQIAPDKGTAGKDDPIGSDIKIYNKVPVYGNSTGNNKKLVTKSNYGTFTYLGHATVTGTGKQTRKAANRNGLFDWSWNQTHDIKLSSSVASGFTPIAAAGTSATNSGYNAVLYAWFGSTYNGNSYKIEDVNITSGAYTVGLFGVTAGAEMKNIIMYSENDAKITRSAPYGSDTLGAYSIGGLIGVAYDYANTDDNKAIENCAIAGYHIVDASKNQQGLGEANVGGLVGVSNGDLTRCSAVTEIAINCTHRAGNSGFTEGGNGNYIRVGGLTGATLGKVFDCYTGGSITVSEETLVETVNSGGYGNGGFVTSGYVPITNNNTSVYLAGIGGSGFAQNYQNFSGVSNYREGSPTYVNCYTYMQFPKLEGTIRGISAIGSLADRYYYGSGLTIKNCYYLDEYLKVDRILDENLVPKYYYNNSVRNIYKTLTEDKLAYDENGQQVLVEDYYYWEMINGTSVCENKLIMGKDFGSKLTGKIPKKTVLADMDNIGLGGSWSQVTTVENGASVNGKYSFPGSDYELQGRNYPFLATVTQDEGNTYVHYGRWPKGNGLFSDKYSITLDLLTEGQDNLNVILTNYVDYNNVAIADPNAVTLSYSELTEEGIVQDNLTSSEIVQVTRSAGANGTVVLNILGLKEGTSTVTASYGGYQATVQVTVTAEYSIGVTPVTVTVDKDGNITGVTDVTSGEIPTAFQQDHLYWKLTAWRYDRNNNTQIPITLEPENWRVEENTIDRNYDDYAIEAVDIVEGGDTQHYILLDFWSNDVKIHQIQVTAFDVIGVSGQQVTGTRSRDVSFEIKKNPPTVYVFAYDQAAAENKPLYTLYQKTNGAGEICYYRDKDGTVLIEQLDTPKDPPVGRDVFRGYFLAANEAGVNEPFTTAQVDGTNKITYTTPIEKSLMVFGMWKAKEYNATFDTLYADVKVVGADANPYTKVYTMEQEVTIPNVDPVEIEDAASGRKLVFTQWVVASTGDPSTWTVGGRFDADTTVDAGMYGDVTFHAVWNTRYNIHYFEENGTELTGMDDSLKTYVGNTSPIHLYVPTAPEGSDLKFVGWTLKESADPTAITGWTTGKLYNEPVAGEGFTGDVELVAKWAKSYPITFMSHENDAAPYEDRYAVAMAYPLPEAPEAEAGYVFDGWKVTAVSADAKGWVLDTIASDLEDGHLFEGEVTLTAQWKPGTYTIYFNLDGGTVKDTGETEIDPIPYTFGTGTIIFPGEVDGSTYTKAEHDATQWIVTKVLSEKSSWSVGDTFGMGSSHEVQQNYYGDVEMQPNWIERTYKVYYDAKGGTMEVAQEYDKYYTAYTKASGVTLAEAKLPGYKLTGWKQSSDGNNETFGKDVWPYGVLLTEKTGNVNMEAQWAPVDYTITYEDQDGNPIYADTEHKYNIESTGTLMPLEVIPAYNVDGWTVKESSGSWVKDQKYSADTTLEGMYGDVTLVCTKIPKSYSLTYWTKDGASYDEGGHDYDYTIKTDLHPLAEAPSRNGYQFDYWKAEFGEEAGGWSATEKYQPGAALGEGFYGDVKLVAQWTAVSYDIKFMDADGTTELYSDTYTIESEQTLKDLVTIPGYNVTWKVIESDTDAWTMDAEYSADTSLTGKYGNVTLQCSAKTAITYKLNYWKWVDDVDGRVAYEDHQDIDYTIETDLKLASAPDRVAYNFDGWMAELGTEYGKWDAKATYLAEAELGAGYYGNVDLIGQWTPVEYTITYRYVNPKGETISESPEEYNITSKETVKAPVADTGYTVSDWKVESSSGSWTAGQVCTDKTALAGMYGDVILVSTRTPIKYQLNYILKVDTADSQTYKTTEYTIEDSITLEGEPTTAVSTDNYADIFIGWKADTDEGGWSSSTLYNAGQDLAAGRYGDVNLTSVYENRKLTLVANGKGTDYFVATGYSKQAVAFKDYFYETYNAPTKPNWELDGWYTSNKVKVLNADGSVVANSNVAGYTSGGYFNLTGDQTLFARWKRSVKVFEKATSLTNGNNYVIGSESGDALYILKATKTNNGYSVGVENVTNKVVIGKADGTTSEAFFIDALPTGYSIQWTIGTVQNSGSRNFRVFGTTNYYLRHQNQLSVSNITNSIGWTVGDNSIYYSAWSWDSFNWVNNYLTISKSGASISTTSSTVSLYTIGDGEMYEYDG